MQVRRPMVKAGKNEFRKRPIRCPTFRYPGRIARLGGKGTAFSEATLDATTRLRSGHGFPAHRLDFRHAFLAGLP